MLKKAKDLLSRTEATSTVVCAEDVPSIFETLPEPSTSRQTDPLETSLVESGPQLLSLNPFEGEEEEIIRPTSTGAARVISQTISVESNITKPQKIIGGKGPKSAGPRSAGPMSAGPKPAGLKTVGGKEPRSAGPKSAGGRDPRTADPKSVRGKDPKTADPKSAGGRPPRPTVGGKAPRKQVVPQKRKSRPGSGSLNYVPTNQDFLEAQVAGDTLPAANKTTRKYRPGCLALQEDKDGKEVKKVKPILIKKEITTNYATQVPFELGPDEDIFLSLTRSVCCMQTILMSQRLKKKQMMMTMWMMIF